MGAAVDLNKVRDLLALLSPDQLEEVDHLIAAENKLWVPLPGPQRMALESPADFLFYGGAAGGGKSDLILGASMTEHRHSIIYRRQATQLVGLVQRATEIVGSRQGYNGQDKVWRLPNDRVLEFGAVNDPGDEEKYQGRPHSLKAFDEITHFLESQFRFLCGWMRTNDPGERQRVICTGNPPTTPEGRWVIKFWAPWLDPMHQNPAEPGELRWFAVIDGEDVEVDGPDPIEHKDEVIQPKSRTFIPSRVEDNPHYLETGYKSTLQALPEPLRSQMLRGDFGATSDDAPDQVIPTAWIESAMARWRPKPEAESRGPMDSMGVDPARGGRDHTMIARRHGVWFAELLDFPGGSTPDGPTVASLVVANRREAAPVHVDAIGVGTSVVDFLVGNGVQTISINGAAKSYGTDRSGRLRFVNLRAELHWKMREALDPQYGDGIQLPLDNELLADLAAPRFMLTPQGIKVESKDDIKKRIGRSPDRGDSVVYALVSTLKDLRPDDDSPEFCNSDIEYDPYNSD